MSHCGTTRTEPDNVDTATMSFQLNAANES